jgi:hypothetical protein
VTVTTNGNNVYVSASGWSEVYADVIAYRILRDGTVNISEVFQDAVLLYIWQQFSLSGLDVGVPAGSHTYTLQVLVSDGTNFSTLVDGEMAVLEIND